MAATLNPKAFPFPADISCPGCHQTITLYDHNGCEAVACPSCCSYLLFNSDGRPYVKEKLGPVKHKPLIPLGITGTLKNVDYKLIAYMEKKEAATRYKWREYMLYNYAKGYAFLAEYDGHWTLIAGANFYPDLKKVNNILGDEAQYDGYDYGKFNTYTPEITALVGEFDWDILAEKIKAKEYIAPPCLLTSEENVYTHITDWYLGEYLEPEEIAAAFKIPEGDFPVKEGIGANQPSKYMLRWQAALKISAAAGILFLLIQIAVVLLRPQKVLLSDTYTLTLPPDTTKHPAATLPVKDSTLTKDAMLNKVAQVTNPAIAALNTAYDPTNTNGNFEFKSFKTPSFSITNGPVPLEFELSSTVENNWLSATVELVSEKDNQTWTISKDIEYYHGYEDGEAWSEGSVNETVLVSKIPAGKYHINVYPYAGSNLPTQLFIRVTAAVTLWRNILVTLLLLCLYPLYCWYRSRKYEIERWNNSNYSPYDND